MWCVCQGRTGFSRSLIRHRPPLPSPRDWRGIAEPGSAVAHGLEAIVQAEPNFDPRAFVEGAKGAYEAIVIAFAKGDRKTLRSLLSRAKSARGSSGRSQPASRAVRQWRPLSSLSTRRRSLPWMSATRLAQVTVHFLSHLITATRSRRWSGDRRQCRGRGRGAGCLDLRPHAGQPRSELAARGHGSRRLRIQSLS